MAQSALRGLVSGLMQGGPAPSGMANYQTAIQNAAQRPQPKPMGQQVADVLGGVALPLSAAPFIGDIAGLGADAAMYANYPEERTALNYGLTLAGMLPFVPGAAGIRAAEGALDMSQAAPGFGKTVTAPGRALAGDRAAALIRTQTPVKASEALGQLMERGMRQVTTTQSDRTKVGGGNIGGAAFPVLSSADPAYAGKAWGVMDSGTASRLTNLTNPETVWTTMLGSATQLKTNPVVFEKLKRAFKSSMRQGNLSEDLASRINQNLRLTFGEGADIRSPDIWKQADTFEKRSALADVMMGQGIAPSKGGVALGGEKSGKGVIFKPSEILVNETERSLLHPEYGGSAPTFAAGPRLFTLEKTTEYRPDLHPGFPTLIGGQDLGVNMMPVPTEVFLPDWHQEFKRRNPNRNPGYYDLALGVKGEGLPSQKLNESYINHLMRSGYGVAGAAVGLSALRQLMPQQEQE